MLHISPDLIHRSYFPMVLSASLVYLLQLAFYSKSDVAASISWVLIHQWGPGGGEKVVYALKKSSLPFFGGNCDNGAVPHFSHSVTAQSFG